MSSDLITIAGFDPAMRNMGMVKGELSISTGVLSSVELLLQKSASKKKNDRTPPNLYDIQRFKSISDSVNNFFANSDLICIEVPIGSQSASAMKSYAFSISLIATLPYPKIFVKPSEVKLAAVNNKNASKADMIKWATEKYPNLDWLRHAGRLTNDNEHLADALATIYAAAKTPDFRSILNKLAEEKNVRNN